MAVFRILFLVFCSFSLIFAESFEDDNEIEGDDDLANYLREAIENFRSQMSTGIPEINMPVLDPLHLEDMDVNVNENVANINLRIQELNIKGLSNFKIHKLVPNMEQFYISVNLSLSVVEAEGRYKLNGKILKIFPLYGDGDCAINITKAQIAGESKLVRQYDTLQMDNLQLNLKWNEVNIFLGNFLGGGRFAEILQQLFPKIGKGAFDQFNPKIMKALNNALTKVVNKELQKPKVKDIIKSIFGEGD